MYWINHLYSILRHFKASRTIKIKKTMICIVFILDSLKQQKHILLFICFIYCIVIIYKYISFLNGILFILLLKKIPLFYELTK